MSEKFIAWSALIVSAFALLFSCQEVNNGVDAVQEARAANELSQGSNEVAENALDTANRAVAISEEANELAIEANRLTVAGNTLQETQLRQEQAQLAATLFLRAPDAAGYTRVANYGLLPFEGVTFYAGSFPSACQNSGTDCDTADVEYERVLIGALEPCEQLVFPLLDAGNTPFFLIATYIDSRGTAWYRSALGGGPLPLSDLENDSQPENVEGFSTSDIRDLSSEERGRLAACTALDE